MRVGSLFAGIGGFDLAARWMGWQTVWYSEIEPYAAAVMKKHFPEAINLGDVTTIDGKQAPPVDLLCGGFPCQDISLAGKGAGLGGARSGLWYHYARLIDEIRPRWVVAENVSALRSRGLDQVLGSLASLGYDAEWHCIPAAYVGAPHRRDRIWIVAYANGDELRIEPGEGLGWPNGVSPTLTRLYGEAQPLADSQREPEPEQRHEAQALCNRGHTRLVPRGCGDGLDIRESESALAYTASVGRREGGASDAAKGSRGRDADRGSLGADVPDADGGRLEECVQRDSAAIDGGAAPLRDDALRFREEMADANDARLEGRGGESLRECACEQPTGEGSASTPSPAERAWWSTEPDVGRVAHGVPARVDRLRCLGNAVVPAVPFLIFQAIQAVEDERRGA